MVCSGAKGVHYGQLRGVAGLQRGLKSARWTVMGSLWTFMGCSRA